MHLSEYMRSEAIDIAIVTETWLTNSVRDIGLAGIK